MTTPTMHNTIENTIESIIDTIIENYRRSIERDDVSQTTKLFYFERLEFWKSQKAEQA